MAMTAVGASRRRRGVRVRASDIEWSLGDGPVMTVTAEAILMTLAGRQPVFGEGFARFAAAADPARDAQLRTGTTHGSGLSLVPSIENKLSLNAGWDGGFDSATQRRVWDRSHHPTRRATCHQRA